MQLQLNELKQPLQAINKARSDVHTRKINLLAEQGLNNVPIEEFSEHELTYLTNRVQQQLTEELPIHLNIG